MVTEPVAIIGAGPGGLVAARYLKSHGYTPTVIESHDEIGGQWSLSNRNSGVWPQMRTNTAKVTTQFSDLDYPGSVAIFPRNGEVLDYLKTYADRYRLLEGARLGTEVRRLERVIGGYSLALRKDGVDEIVAFPRVVVASGRYNRPNIPAVEGLSAFAGDLGVRHAFHYKDPELYRGKRVIVAGGSISALEIASDLAMLGAAAVFLSQRRQRYVLPKMVRGVPLEYYAFTRAGALARDTASPQELAKATLEFVTQCGGDPSRYGAPKPHSDISKAGFTGSQHYLNLVAEDRLSVRPWIERVDRKRVTFTDGRSEEVEAILFGTGFDLNLDFLSPEISAIVANGASGLQLANFTFHPDLPGLAFLGLWSQQGPYAVPLEQQARYIAYTWAGILPAKSDSQERRALAACAAEGHHSDYRDQNEMALRFARLCGTDPVGIGDGAFQTMLARSATTAITFRLTGPDALPSAEKEFRRQFETYAPADRVDRIAT